MEQYFIDLSKWDKSGGKYTYPGTPDKSSWYMHGFVPMNDYTEDLYGWYGFTFDTDIEGREEIEIKAYTLEFKEGRNVEVGNEFRWRTTVFGNGRKRITARLSGFDLYSCEPGMWKYLRSVEINKEVRNLKAVRAPSVWARSEIYSKSARTGETVKYEIKLTNCGEETKALSLELEKQGRETLNSKITPETLCLKPGEEAVCTLETTMNDLIVPGGFEKQRVRILPNGDETEAEKLEFVTVKYLPHPYIIHTEDGWDEVKEKPEKSEWARALSEDYIKKADEWEIPRIDSEKPYLYVTENAHKCFNSALVWKLTGNMRYAEKSAEFLKSVADPKRGYPATLRACNQQMVHEGEFFKSCAFAYDLLYDTGLFSEQNHRDMENAFRIFMGRIDWELSCGALSNWSLAMIAGALYCAMCIQDRAMIERFVYGTGGITEHMSACILPDGWWCECTIGYNLMAAGLFSEYAQALFPWGINLKDMWVPASYAKKVVPRSQHVDGLSWDIYGGTSKNYRCIRDLWDSLVSMADYRGVIFGVNDSAETQLGGRSEAGFDSRYDIAYAHYRDPAYADIIKKGGPGRRDLLRGELKLPETEAEAYQKSCRFENAGISVLRSQKPGREPREQYQASLKYGSHGGAHGHYDRCALNSLSRFGKNFYNPENIWYAYGTFMYKFFVQNSITHNMVTADLKLQDPTEGRELLFYSGKMMQVGAAENITRWSNPPYGGWRVLLDETFSDRTQNEGRYVPVPHNAPEYGARTDFTEPITQRRLLALTDEYAVIFDYAEGAVDHDFDCIYHARGLKSIEGTTPVKHTEQLTSNPLSSGQFITDCFWQKADGPVVKLRFESEYTDGEAAKPGWRVPFRSGYNEPGPLKMDLYYLNASGAELILGGDPEYEAVNKRLSYRVETDGEVAAEGKFGAWILGREHVKVDLRGKKQLKLTVRCSRAFRETDELADYEKTIFWGDPHIVTKSGEKIYLADMDYTCENIDTDCEAGKDYFGGPVTIQAKDFPKAVAAEPAEENRDAVITVDLRGLNPKEFDGYIGGDYPLGDDHRRKFISCRKTARRAAFISIIELYENKSKIARVAAGGDNRAIVQLTDGTIQEIIVSGLDTGENPKAEIHEYKNNKLARSERTGRR